MEIKQAIIKNIISEAEQSAKSLIKAAELEKQASLEFVHEELLGYEQKLLQKAEKDAQDLIDKAKNAAKMEKSKNFLFVKQQLLGSVYEQAINKILNMTDKIYCDFIASLIKRYAENRDICIVSERDARRLTPKWLEKVAAECGLSLSMSHDYHSARGGIILSGKNYDKNLTLDTLAKQLREETESKIAKKLFEKN